MVEWGQLSSRKLEGGNASTVQLWLKVGSVGKAVMAGKSAVEGARGSSAPKIPRAMH